MRAFNEVEKTKIRHELIKSYESCLNRYGIQKTSIDEIVKMVGISKGSFYLFYESKEMLFVDVLDNIQEHIKARVYEQTYVSGSPKELLKEIIFCVYQEIKKTPWILNLDSLEYERLLRRLPPELLAKHMSRDSVDIAEIMEHFGIRLKISREAATATLRILLISILYDEKIGPHLEEALQLLIDGLVQQAVED